MSRPGLWSTTTSGDLLADRRFAYADAALGEGDDIAARDLFEQVIEIAPAWPPAHFALGKACLAQGDAAAARAALEHVLVLDPEDRLGAGLLLARQAGAATRAAMPDAFVAALFDEYAPRFDAHLTGALAYRAPALLAGLLARHPAPPCRAVFDLGCGTGLMARALPGSGAWQGVDLSGAMLAEAEASGLYSTLERAELLAWLRARGDDSADLVVAADVFCYVPDLEPVFAQAARVLRAGGRFAFSIQTQAGDGAIIGADARVHHAPRLIRTLAAGNGFSLLAEETVSTRRDRGQDVPGALFLLNRA
jgi:predicted TPR repeat methyltransferase